MRNPTTNVTIRLFVAAVLIGLCFVSPKLVFGSEKTREYVVVQGDSCVKVATKELGKRKGYKEIHRLNKDLGPSPHKLKPGQVLLLPDGRNPDANLTSKTGSVRVRPIVKDWQSGTAGMDLYRKWRVNSEDKSSALLTFEDKSTLTMRENSLVIIYGQPSETITSKDGHVVAKLETGALRARMNKALGQKELVVQTPTSEATLIDGSSVISAEEGRTTLSNHEGGGVLLKQRIKNNAKGGKSVKVKAGMGSWSKKNEAPVPPVPLPPAPRWTVLDTLHLGGAPTGIDLTAKWSKVPEAVSYRVEVALDPIARAVVSSVVVPANIQKLEAHGFKQGDYYLSVSSIDKNGLESTPNKSDKITLLALEVKSPEGKILASHDDENKPGIKKQTLDVLPFESEMSVPGGIECGFDRNNTASTVLLNRAGLQTLHCLDGQKNHLSFEVTVGASTYPPEVKRIGRANNAKMTESIPVLFGVRYADGRDLDVKACKEGSIKYVSKTQHTIEGVLEMQSFTPRCEIQFLQANANVGAVSVHVDKLIAKPRASFDIRWDVFTGIESTRIEDDDGGEAGILGARLSWRRLTSIFRGELEFGLMAGGDSYNEGSPAALMSANVRMMPKNGAIKPFILAGAGVFLNPGERVLPQIHAGAGAAYSIGKTQLLAEIRGAFGEDRSGVLSGMLGVSFPFGSKSP